MNSQNLKNHKQNKKQHMQHQEREIFTLCEMRTLFTLWMRKTRSGWWRAQKYAYDRKGRNMDLVKRGFLQRRNGVLSIPAVE